MTQSFDANKQLDRAHLEAYYGGITSGLDMIYEIFLEETEPSLNTAYDHLTNGSFKEAGDIIHAILPSFTTIGLPILSTSLRVVYNNIRAEEKISSVDGLREFVTEFKLYLPAINDELVRLKALQ
jgi:hypothetical protein